VDLRDEQNAGPDERPKSRIIVPEGPMWEAMIAPDGHAVSLSVQVMKLEARRLRRARPQPFGFAPDSSHPMPERIGEAHGSGFLSGGLATVLGRQAAVRTMSIFYGDAADHSAPVARIISDFHRAQQDRDLEEALREAAAEWRTPAPAPDEGARAGRVDGASATVTSEAMDVAVAGTRGPVPMLRLGELSAFQIRHEEVLVTVLAKHMGSEFPEIVRLTDLESMISGLEHPDRQVIAAAFAEKRRRQIVQMRNQTGHNS
jgi:hypothetical protein